jgi:lactate racemase
MRVRLAYGEHDLTADLPSATTVVQPVHRRAAADPYALLREALRRPVAGRPLRELARPGQQVAISVCDITRPQPRPLMLRAILDELDGVVRPDDVVILIATGTHRANTPEELDRMLGSDVCSACRVANHVSSDGSSLVDLGLVGDVPVFLNRTWLEADLRITTGFVEPHFFAGFSGGPKMVAPGLAGLETVLALHNARRIADPRATWGICEGNPVHDAIRAIAASTGVHFGVDVLLNEEQEITRAFGGPVLEMHAQARAAAREEAMRPVPAYFDVVLTTNSGYPLDQNLYQTVKGISAAAEIVRPGGTILCVSECREGLPENSEYARLLRSGSSPGAVLDLIMAAPATMPDQWQAQIQARVQARADVWLKADGLDDRAIASVHLKPFSSIEGTLGSLLRRQPDAKLAVLPEGPQTIAFVSPS